MDRTQASGACNAGSSGLPFTKVCSILEIVRTVFAACGGEEIPPRKDSENAAEPHR